MLSGTLGWDVVYGRIRRTGESGPWLRGLPVDDPSFAWWVTRNLKDCFELGYGLELANDGPTER
jgi:hypothetical protein